MPNRFKAWVHVKAVLTSLNTAFLPISRVEFVVGFLLCSERFFSGYSGFPLSSKTNISTLRFHPGMHGHILNEFLRTPRCSVGKQITFFYEHNHCLAVLCKFLGILG